MKKLEDMAEPELKALCNTLARVIEFTAENMGCEKPLFALVLFNDPKLGQYVSNCRREDVVKALRETADRLQRREDVTRWPNPPTRGSSTSASAWPTRWASGCTWPTRRATVSAA